MEKLLQAKNKKSGHQAGQPTSTASVTPAMRQHAQIRLTQAMQSNTHLVLNTVQQHAGCHSWEASLFQRSNSKSAYLSKLSNAVSQIKRAVHRADIDGPHVQWKCTAQQEGGFAASLGVTHVGACLYVYAALDAFSSPASTEKVTKHNTRVSGHPFAWAEHVRP